jgi:hypothetical protein
MHIYICVSGNVSASFMCSVLQNFQHILILLVPAVGIPLPANFNKQSGPQIDDNEHLSSGNSEIHPVEASKLLVPEGRGAGTAFLTGIICYL